MGCIPSRKGAIALSDDEKGHLYEQDPTRLSKERPLRRRLSGMNGGEKRGRYTGNWAPHPGFIRALRFFLYLVTSASSLATAAMCLAVVWYYNHVGPVIKPSWGSLIAVIVFGIATPGILFGTLLVTPRLFRAGSVPDMVNQTRMELLMLFSLAAIWISGALALACDLRGKENCLWDGYYHYPKPSDFDDVCNRINYSVALAYTTFGLCAAQMAIVWAIALYILLFLDQEILTEKTNALGTRAYLARARALQQRRVLRAAREAGVSTAGPFNSRASPTSFGATREDELRTAAGPMAGGVVASRAAPAVPAGGGPRGGGGGATAPSALPIPTPTRTPTPPKRTSSVRFAAAAPTDEGPGEREADDDPLQGAEHDPFDDERGGYYGFEDERGFAETRGGHLRV
ncbi:hypothetical protein JCM21900_003422 [Sporobolomyces salmonicolor]